jgi:hypothetical protein
MAHESLEIRLIQLCTEQSFEIQRPNRIDIRLL